MSAPPGIRTQNLRIKSPFRNVSPGCSSGADLHFVSQLVSRMALRRRCAQELSTHVSTRRLGAAGGPPS
ncbi:MAG: hypothetical protein QOG64_1446 [Acidimicrobiaceae bacterium]|nr:hypothetical protein [Acidimicrobiaceae bacterium]